MQKRFIAYGERMKSYGIELIIDLKECDVSKFDRSNFTDYFQQLCNLLGMKRADLHFWDDYKVPKKERQTKKHLKGTSAVQFIMTSNITIHSLDLVGELYVNIFSCGEFDVNIATTFTKDFFGGQYMDGWKVIKRGKGTKC